MAQGDYLIQNQSFPSFRSDLNSTLEAINTSNSGTSRPSSAVAGTVWLDTTNATNPTLKFFDGTDDISLAQLDYTANTVNWLDSSVVADLVNDTTPQLGGDLDVNGNDIVSVSNGNITFTPDGTGKVIIDGLSFPTSDGSADQVLKTDGAGNLSFGDVSGGTNWQSSIVTGTTLSAVAGNGYWIDTTSNACTVTLPSSASVGDSIQIVDYAGTFATNNITLTSSLNINGATDDKVLTTNREGVTITYADATQGWVASSGVNSGDQALDPAPYSADFLVIAGGGSGAKQGGAGGGGAGGYRNSYSTESSGGGGSSESSLTFNTGTVYTITVGAGGAGVSSGVGNDGVDSSISGTGITTITSIGGGNGGGASGSASGVGGNGGSGGGGGITGFNGTTATSSGTANQGYGGGSGSSDGATFDAGGGGGGASAVGGNGVSGASGSGGNGLASSITGSSVTRTGGGGGCGSGVGSGGSGGGGSGDGSSGTANTGSGGGSADVGDSGSGGSGVVILRMPTVNYSGTTTGSPTVGTDGTDTILTFTGSGSYTG